MSVIFVPVHTILSDLWTSYLELNFSILEKGGVAVRFINDIKKQSSTSSGECVPITMLTSTSISQVSCSDENDLVNNSQNSSNLTNIQFRKKLHQKWIQIKIEKNLTIVAFKEFDESTTKRDMMIKPLLDLLYPGLFDMVYFTTNDPPQNVLQSFWQLFKKRRFECFFNSYKDTFWLKDQKQSIINDERFELKLVEINNQISINNLDNLPKPLSYLNQFLAPVDSEKIEAVTKTQNVQITTKSISSEKSVISIIKP